MPAVVGWAELPRAASPLFSAPRRSVPLNGLVLGPAVRTGTAANATPPWPGATLNTATACFMRSA
jgi:hypothetical protein